MIIDRLSHSRVKMKAKITTIIPTFRRPHLVGRAICSVLSQNYEKFEVRVLDNASGDETGEVVKRIASGDPRVTYHCHPFDIGPWRNFKYGLDSVETPFFNLLSDDDALLPGFFTAALDSLERHPQAGMFAGATVRVGPKFISTPVLKSCGEIFPIGTRSCSGAICLPRRAVSISVFSKQLILTLYADAPPREE
jgi:glycosyltransferase involved in cell wall biosynthesis